MGARVLVGEPANAPAEIVRAARKDAQRKPGPHPAVVGIVVGKHGLFRALQRFRKRFPEHGLRRHLADRGVVHIEGGARHDPAHAAFPGRLRRLAGVVAARIEKAGGAGLDQLELAGPGGPIRILRRHLRLVAVEPLQELLGDVAFVGETAAEMLGVVHVRVHEAGQHEEAGGVDRLHVRAGLVRGRLRGGRLSFPTKG